MRFLENDRIRLRAVEPEDASMMWEIETDSSQWRENGMSAPYSLRNISDYAISYDADPIRAGQVRLICELKSEGKENEIFGIADLYDISPIGRTAFIGLYVSKSYRGRHLASEALKLLEDYAANLLNLRIVAAKIADTNVGSQRIFEEAGYMLSGKLNDWLLSGKETASLLIFTKKLL